MELANTKREIKNEGNAKLKIKGSFPVKLKINTISLSGEINTISRTVGGRGGGNG